MTNNYINRELILDQFTQRYTTNQITAMVETSEITDELYNTLFEIAAEYIKDSAELEEAILMIMAELHGNYYGDI